MSRALRLCGALEEEVLQVVRGAVQGGRLVAGADVRPDAEGGGADGGQGLGDDAQAAGEGGAADGADAVLPLMRVWVRATARASEEVRAVAVELRDVTWSASSFFVVGRLFALDHGDQGELAA